LSASSTMRTACLSLLLVTACWALPFHQTGFLDFMMEDDAGSGVTPDPNGSGPSGEPVGPKCPFRCQCHLRVIQCSDLGKTTHLQVMAHIKKRTKKCKSFYTFFLQNCLQCPFHSDSKLHHGTTTIPPS
ncbi:hypothetical protein XENOCAPTIV_004666, partial [Xenoophorus captivus]